MAMPVTTLCQVVMVTTGSKVVTAMTRGMVAQEPTFSLAAKGEIF
jgi:hypothetical protein